MEKELYINLRKQIEYYLPEIKYVRLWNNQFNKSNGSGSDGRSQVAFDYPCVFIEFHDANFRDWSLGIQEFDLECTLHLGFKSFETEDLEILELKEKLYWVVQRFQQGNFARFSRRAEIWDVDHDNVSVLKMQFHTYGKDDYRYVFAGSTLDSITGATITETIVSATTLNTDWSGATDSNGANLYGGQLPTFECE